MFETPSPIGAKFGIHQYTHGLHLYAKFHLDQFIVSTLQSEKLLKYCKLTKFPHFRGSCANPLFTDPGKIWRKTVYPRVTFICQI